MSRRNRTDRREQKEHQLINQAIKQRRKESRLRSWKEAKTWSGSRGSSQTVEEEGDIERSKYGGRNGRQQQPQRKENRKEKKRKNQH